jgi:MFS family permease
MSAGREPARDGTDPPGAECPLPREVVRLGWISFCLDLAGEAIYPLIPLFLATMTRAPAQALGLIEGAAEGALNIATAWSGRRSDRIRRRVPFLRWGYGLAAVSKPLLALAGSWPAVLALRSADRLGKGLRTAPRDALVVDLVGFRQRGGAFGFHRAMDTAGSFVGVLLALAAMHFLPGRYRTIFALTAIPALAAVALTFRLREPPRAALGTAAAPAAPISSLPRSIWRVAAVLWIFALGNSSDTFLLLRATDSGFGAVEVVWAYALMNLTYALVAFPAGRWSDRIGRERVMVVGWILYALVYAAFAWVDPGLFWIAFAVYGVYMGITQGVAKAWIADHAPAELRGTALGVFQFGQGFALMAGNAVAGWSWEHVDPSAPFLIGSGAAVAALLALPLARDRRDAP